MIKTWKLCGTSCIGPIRIKPGIHGLFWVIGKGSGTRRGWGKEGTRVKCTVHRIILKNICEMPENSKKRLEA